MQNTAYAYYTMTEGNPFANKFTPEDYLTLYAHGVHADGTEATAEFPLAKDGQIRHRLDTHGPLVPRQKSQNCISPWTAPTPDNGD